MALLEAKTTTIGFTGTSSTTTSVFSQGALTFDLINLETSPNSSPSTAPSPPKPLLIVTPNVKGSYPVVMFLHGFCIENYFYKNLLQHIASHGFILVAPQLYEIIEHPLTSGPEEIEPAAKVTKWLEEGLQPRLPEEVAADLSNLVVSGHSRGGKAAFALAVGYYKEIYSLEFKVLIGIDPVAGMEFFRTEPHILSYVPRSFDISIPVAVFGTGLGDERKFLMPPCAPDGLNHKEFFNECKPTCGYFVAKDYGHMDVLDDSLPGLAGEMVDCACKNGTGPRDYMRRSVGGIVVAFLRAYLGGNQDDLDAIVSDPSLAPATLDPVELIRA